MDLKRIKEIKQEDPVEYFLISPISDEELDVAPETYSNSENLAESTLTLTHVKQEPLEDIQPFADDVRSDHIHKDTDEVTSDYEPDSKYEDDVESDMGDDWTNDTKETLPKILSTKSNYPISVIDYDDITFIGPPFACNLCSLTFPILKSLKAHRKIHKGKKFQCEICKAAFKNRSHIYDHIKLHLQPQFSCPICSRKFALKKSFIRHQDTHQEIKLECDICSKFFRQKATLIEHMKVHTGRIRQFQCEICDTAFYEQRTLNRHMKFVHSILTQKRFRCQNRLCDKSFMRIEQFRKHSCVEAKPLRDKQKCSHCDKQFLTKYEMNRHVQRVHGNIRNNFKCNECGKTFGHSYWPSFVQHVAQKCGKIMYECDYCSKLLPSKLKLVEHFVIVHNIATTAKTLDCPQCNRTFFHKISLNKHLKRNHIKQKCDHCNKIFRSKSGCTLHKRHCLPKKMTESHACKICKCSFITEANLLEHQIEVHLEKKFKYRVSIYKYRCSTCDKPFGSLASLSRHNHKSHKNKTNFECSSCNGTYIGEEVYQKHFADSECVRKQIERYQCIVCSKLFTRKENLKKHVKALHSNASERFHCDICERSYASKRSILKHFQRGNHQNSWKCEFCSANFREASYYKMHKARVHTSLGPSHG